MSWINARVDFRSNVLCKRVLKGNHRIMVLRPL